MSNKVVSLNRAFSLLVVLSLLMVAIPIQAVSAQSSNPEPQVVYSIGGEIPDEYKWYYGPYYEESGDTMSIRITWVPSTSGVRLGLCTSPTYTSCTWTGTIYGGSANKSWTVSTSRNYYIGIWNKGPETIQFSGYIDV